MTITCSGKSIGTLLLNGGTGCKDAVVAIGVGKHKKYEWMAYVGKRKSLLTIPARKLFVGDILVLFPKAWYNEWLILWGIYKIVQSIVYNNFDDCHDLGCSLKLFFCFCSSMCWGDGWEIKNTSYILDWSIKYFIKFRSLLFQKRGNFYHIEIWFGILVVSIRPLSIQSLQ